MPHLSPNVCDIHPQTLSACLNGRAKGKAAFIYQILEMFVNKLAPNESLTQRTKTVIPLPAQAVQLQQSTSNCIIIKEDAVKKILD